MPTIVKGDGSQEVFDVSKLEGSMARSGADKELVQRVASKIAGTIRDGMTTTEIYRSAFAALKKEESSYAAKYSMRRAILELGPTGYPFENYFCELMTAKGYDTKVRQILKGRCTEHEVDVIFSKNGVTAAAELKFHNVPGFKTDLKTALYVRARYWDIEQRAETLKQPCEIDEAWLITNTKFTKQALDYATCAGLKLLGWSYPREGNLSQIVQETGLYPITVLTSISRKEEARLLAGQVTLCRDVVRNPELLFKTGIPRKKHKDIISESMQLCGS